MTETWDAVVNDLLSRYAASVDHRDYADLAATFGDNGRLIMTSEASADEGPATVLTGGDTIAEAVRTAHAHYEVTYHLLGQHRVEPDPENDNVASVEAYCVAHHVYTHDSTRYDRVLHIRYHDRVSRAGDTCRFDERRLIVDFSDHRQLSPPPDGAA